MEAQDAVGDVLVDRDSAAFEIPLAEGAARILGLRPWHKRPGRALTVGRIPVPWRRPHKRTEVSRLGIAARPQAAVGEGLNDVQLLAASVAMQEHLAVDVA